MDPITHIFVSTAMMIYNFSPPQCVTDNKALLICELEIGPYQLTP